MDLRIPVRGDIIRTPRTEVVLGVKINFWHWAVFVSPEEIIHYTSPTSDAGGDTIMIQATEFKQFLKGNELFEVVNFPSNYETKKSYSQGSVPSNNIVTPGTNPLKWLLPGFLSIPMAAARIASTVNAFNYKIATPDEVVKRARSRCGEKKYHFMMNNCEHFAVFCKTGIHESEQSALWKYLESINKSIDDVGEKARTIRNVTY